MASSGVLRPRSSAVVRCYRCPCTLGSGQSQLSASTSAAGFSGRVGPRFELPSVSSTSAGRRVRRPRTQVPVLDFSRPRLTEAVSSQIPRSSSHHPAARGGQSSDARLNLEEDVIKNPNSLAPLLSRAARIPHVSTSPALGTDSIRKHFAGGELHEEDDPNGELPPDLQAELMPRHVAIIMDGNSRWAKRRGMHTSFGHAAGVEALMTVAKVASKWGVDVFTVFAFSTENWGRPQAEVDFLMQLFETKLLTELEGIMRNNFRVRFVGDLMALPASLQPVIDSVNECTSSNTGMIVNVCLNYSGRADIVRACQRLAAQVSDHSLSPADIDDAAVAKELYMSELGALQDPDLVIRTSGEKRISNFLLWQVAYSEFVFSDTLWPDFGREDLRAALVTYQRRIRRYGLRQV